MVSQINIFRYAHYAFHSVNDIANKGLILVHFSNLKFAKSSA